jgi:hypothetical protein
MDSGGFPGTVATVTITVNAVNDAPVASDNSYSVSADRTLVVSAPGVLSNDVDADGDVLSVSLVAGPLHGTIVFSADGSFSYTPDLLFSGSDSFSYEVTDGLDSVIATVTIDVVEPEGGSAALPTPVAIEPAPPERDPLPASDPAGTSPIASWRGENKPMASRSQESSRRGALGVTHEQDSGLVAPLVTNISMNVAAFDGEYWIRKSTDMTGRWSRKLQFDSLGFSFDASMLWDRFDSVRVQLGTDLRSQVFTAGAATALASAFSVGYLVWTLRGGYLLATVLSSLPAWRMMDPLPILECDREKSRDGTGDEDSGEDETLVSLVAKKEETGDGLHRNQEAAI